MRGSYKLSLELWPFFSPKGREEAQKDVGERSRHFIVEANNFDQAYEKCKLIIEGIKTNPHLWQVHIVEIKYGNFN